MRQVRLAAVLLLVLATTASGQVRQAWPSGELLVEATSTGAGERKRPVKDLKTFHVYGETTAGAGAATVVIEVSNVEVPSVDGDWIVAGTVTLTLSTTRTSDGFAMAAPWRNVRARVTAISGTGAKVSARIGS